MKRAWTCAFVVLAGCGSSKPAAHHTVATVAPPATTVATVAPPSPTSASATATPTTATTPTPTATSARSTGPAPDQPVLGGAVVRYVQALDEHAIPELCAGFTPPKPPVCAQGQGEGQPRVARVALLQQPKIKHYGRRHATATVTLGALGADGQRLLFKDVFVLARRSGTWVVTRPNATFAKVVGAKTHAG